MAQEEPISSTFNLAMGSILILATAWAFITSQLTEKVEQEKLKKFSDKVTAVHSEFSLYQDTKVVEIFNNLTKLYQDELMRQQQKNKRIQKQTRFLGNY